REAGRWRQHHRRCARLLEARRPTGEVGLEARIAEHWIEAGEPERALEPLLTGIQETVVHGDHDLRNRLLERRAELLDELGVPAGDRRRLEQRIEANRVTVENGSLSEGQAELLEIWDAVTVDHARLQARAASGLQSFSR
ncbi:MAG: hypothetical protein ABEN55_07720, partial [Bradymonadaceae bacterium]